MSISDALEQAQAFFQAGQLYAAERRCREILCLSPSLAPAWHLLGVIHLAANAPNSASQCLDRAIQLDPHLVVAHIDRGRAYKAEGRIDEAIESCRRAIQLEPASVLALCNLGNLYASAGRFEEGLACLNQAIELAPDMPELYYNLGSTYLDLGQLEAAVRHLTTALQLRPDYAEAHYNLGIARRDQHLDEDAAQCFRRAAELNPDYSEARVIYGLELLLSGNFEQGWPEYEWRWKTGKLRQRAFTHPRWQGESLTGKTILIHAEQGLGDTLQFVRYAQIVKQLGATVIFEAPRRLLSLLSSARGIDLLVARGDALPHFDVHVPLLSIPGILKTDLASIPAHVPYLVADPQLVRHWKIQLVGIEGRRIGIHWRGRPGQGYWRARDIPLEQFAPLSKIHGVRLINLQYGVTPEELTVGREGLNLAHLGDQVDQMHGAFMDTAAVMQSLELVVTSDTSIAHLAGALGVPVWVLLPLEPDWRWLRDRADSPWYPTMRLFRQRQPGDWAGPIKEIVAALVERSQDDQSKQRR